MGFFPQGNYRETPANLIKLKIRYALKVAALMTIFATIVGIPTYIFEGFDAGSDMLESDTTLADNFDAFRSTRWSKKCTLVHDDASDSDLFRCGKDADNFVNVKQVRMEEITSAQGGCLVFAKYQIDLGNGDKPIPYQSIRGFDACWPTRIFGWAPVNPPTKVTVPTTGLSAK